MADLPIADLCMQRERNKSERPIKLKIEARAELDGEEFSLAFVWDEREGDEAFAPRAKTLQFTMLQTISNLRGDWGETAKRNFQKIVDPQAKREGRQYAEFTDALKGAIVGAPADPEAFG